MCRWPWAIAEAALEADWAPKQTAEGDLEDDMLTAIYTISGLEAEEFPVDDRTATCRLTSIFLEADLFSGDLLKKANDTPLWIQVNTDLNVDLTWQSVISAMGEGKDQRRVTMQTTRRTIS